ncbi:MAG TPA: hypothetical protein VHS28_08430 [Chloroflexota bacterium]|nr:hypothetical protein [Chloroflexota bacterium]
MISNTCEIDIDRDRAFSLPVNRAFTGCLVPPYSPRLQTGGTSSFCLHAYGAFTSVVVVNFIVGLIMAI